MIDLAPVYGAEQNATHMTCSSLGVLFPLRNPDERAGIIVCAARNGVVRNGEDALAAFTETVHDKCNKYES